MLGGGRFPPGSTVEVFVGRRYSGNGTVWRLYATVSNYDLAAKTGACGATVDAVMVPQMALAGRAPAGPRRLTTAQARGIDRPMR